MGRRLIWLIPVALVAAYFVVPMFSSEFTIPENFPVLDTDELVDVKSPTGDTEVATFGSGCFWCTEAVFAQMKGVRTVVSGYSGGHVANPTYDQIGTGLTGHAEVVQVTFDPNVVTYAELLEVFWRSHDPTTRDRQGHDTGPQYRSAIFTHSEQQQRLAERYKLKIDAASVYARPIVTQIAPLEVFYPADSSHQNYFAENSRQPYCRTIIRPKLEKLRAVFRDRLRED